MDCLVELLYEEVYVVAPPVAFVRDAVIMESVFIIVWYVEACDRIGIEVVVHVNTVNIVTCYDIAHYVANVIAVLGNTRVQYEQVVILETALWVAYGNMADSKFLRGFCFGTVGVDPCVQFHAASVTLVDHPLQRVPIWIGRFSLLSCKKAAPRFNLTLIESVTFGTYLKDDNVDAVFLQFVELIGERLLHFLGTHALELPIDALYPCPTELSLRLCQCRTE